MDSETERVLRRLQEQIAELEAVNKRLCDDLTQAQGQVHEWEDWQRELVLAVEGHFEEAQQRLPEGRQAKVLAELLNLARASPDTSG